MNSNDLILEKKIDGKNLVDIIRDEWVNNSIVCEDVYTDIEYKKRILIIRI